MADQSGREPCADQDPESRSARFLRHVLDSLFVFAGVCTRDGILIETNQPSLAAVGASAEDVLGRPFPETPWWSWSAESKERLREAIRRAAAGETVRYDTELRVADGSLMPVDFQLVPMRDDDGRITHLIPSAIDISERIETRRDLERREHVVATLNQTLETRVAERSELAEQRMAQLRQLALELSRAEQRERRRLSQLLHDDLQQLLVAARMRVGRIQKKAPDESTRHQAEKALDILDQGIETARSLATELSPPVLHDGGLVQGVHWLARRMHQQHGLRVTVATEQEIMPLDTGVRILLFEAVRELLFNVVKHAGVKEATVSIDANESDVTIRVQDGGRGFDPSTLDLRAAEGEGFGLLSIRERIEAVGGTMHIDGHPGGGARFTLTCPLRAEEALALPEAIEAALATVPRPAGEARNAASPEPSAADDAGSIRIVVCDDHDLVREGVVSMLRAQADFQVVGEAADGEEAVRLANRLNPDLIVMDITLPKLNGIEATRRIKAEHPEMAVLGLSVHGERELTQALTSAGAGACVRKNGPADELFEAIRELSGGHSPTREPLPEGDPAAD